MKGSGPRPKRSSKSRPKRRRGGVILDSGVDLEVVAILQREDEAGREAEIGSPLSDEDKNA